MNSSIQDSSIQVAPARGLRARLRRMVLADDSAVMWLRLWRGLAVLVLLFGFGSLARAQSCTIISLPTLAFGLYDPIGTNATVPNDTASTTVEVQCSSPPGTGNPDVAFLADVGPGAHPSGIQRRMMAGSGDYLGYGIYLDGNRSLPLGTQSGGVAMSCVAGKKSFPCDGGNDPRRGRWAGFMLYGRVPAGQDPAVGAYSDTLLLTITY